MKTITLSSGRDEKPRGTIKLPFSDPPSAGPGLMALNTAVASMPQSPDLLLFFYFLQSLCQDGELPRSSDNCSRIQYVSPRSLAGDAARFTGP
jgi:hypothetical protein